MACSSSSAPEPGACGRGGSAGGLPEAGRGVYFLGKRCPGAGRGRCSVPPGAPFLPPRPTGLLPTGALAGGRPHATAARA